MSRNAALLLAARLVSAGTTVLLLSYLGHTQGGEALGVAAIGLAVGALLTAFCDAGTASLLIREGARDPQRLGPLLVAMSAWRMVAIPITSLVAWAIVAAVIPASAAAVFLLALGLAVQQFADLTRAVFIARQEMHVSSLHSVAENLGWLAAIVAVLAGGGTLEVAFTAGLIVLVVSTAVGFVLVGLAGVRPLRLPDHAALTTLARQIGPFAAFVIIGVTYARIDTLLIGALLSAGALAAAGAYFSAARLLAALEYLPEAVARAAYPRLSMAYRDGRASVVKELRPIATFLLIVGLPIPLVMLLVGPTLMTAVFGADVAPYAWLVVPLSVFVPVRFLSHLFGTALTSADAQGRRVVAAGIALAIVVVLDVTLIPLLGTGGAVIGFGAASLWVFAVYAVPIVRYVGTMDLPRKGLRYALIATALGLVGTALSAGLGPALAVLLLVPAYAAAALLIERRRQLDPTRPGP